MQVGPSGRPACANAPKLLLHFGGLQALELRKHHSGQDDATAQHLQGQQTLPERQPRGDGLHLIEVDEPRDEHDIRLQFEAGGEGSGGCWS